MIYKLQKYTVFADSEVEHTVFEHEDEETVVEKALELSKEAMSDYTAFRIERWENDKRIVGGWRFFQKGEEFTGWIREAAKKGLQELKRDKE
ncbi:hypothetical protein D3C81_997810 [compost metagenome]